MTKFATLVLLLLFTSAALAQSRYMPPLPAFAIFGHPLPNNAKPSAPHWRRLIHPRPSLPTRSTSRAFPRKSPSTKPNGLTR